ncbi:hypothetical protein [Tuberibacillus sp. Marseille-P3662]|uniref:hypothetical protein n=1 Tax=Tuberibacillus sp. Marseille-P3662 TaxID=1965358 RepID=UPI0015938F0A|nr:hypothetical protein [Tuberibacillus sp. Marseille-P3662]
MNKVRILNGHDNVIGKPKAGNTVTLSAIRVHTTTTFLSTTMPTEETKVVQA